MTNKVTADDIFKRSNRERPVIDVPEWGVKLRVRKMSFERMMEISRNATNVTDTGATFDKDHVVDAIIELSWKEDADEPFFEERHREHLLQEDFDIVLYVFKEIMRFNTKSKEEAEKN